MTVIKNKFVLGVFSIFLFVGLFGLVSAWQFSGIVYDVNGAPLDNATVNVTMITGPLYNPIVVNSTLFYTNSSGNFNLTLPSNFTYQYEIFVSHYHNNKTNFSSGADYLDYIGKSLPPFSLYQFSQGNSTNFTFSTNFYLQPAGVLNISAQGPVFAQVVNETGAWLNGTNYTVSKAGSPGFSQFFITGLYNASSGAPINFGNMVTYPDGVLAGNQFRTGNWSNVTISYMYRFDNATPFRYNVKDMQTGYLIASNFMNSSYNELIHVPANRNYSIEIFPDQSMPVSYEWNNFSSPNNLNITLQGSVNSTYNATTKSLNKMFNTSMNFNLRVTGYANTSTGAAFTRFNITSFILEPGNMVSLDGAMPYNMSSWQNQGTDIFNKTTGFYNMTIPGAAEGENVLMFATALKGGKYYGGYANVSLNYSSINPEANFTLYPLMGSSVQNLSLMNPSGGSNINIPIVEQQFNLVNSSGSLVAGNTHVEVTVDYSNWGSTKFTFMANPNTGSFYVPLLNITGVSNVNIYTDQYAPKTLTSLSTPSLIFKHNNITLSPFKPGNGINNQVLSQVQLELLKSNSTCNLPNPSSSCTILSSAQNPNGDPFGAMIGGGKLDFEMGLISSGIIVKYINVDMIASGPPSAIFDSSATQSTSGDFSSAMRFGSLGPKIYDYALISIPYTKGTSSTNGLNDSAPVHVSIPYFYLDNASGDLNWQTPVWSTASNGTSASALAGNYSHFAGDLTAWQTLMSGTVCVTNQSLMSISNPCYIDKTNHRIWLRIPHFSGIKPQITGTVIGPSSSGNTGGSVFGGGGSAANIGHSRSFNWNDLKPGKATVMNGFDNATGIKEISVNVKKEMKNVQVTVTSYEGKPSSLSVSVNKSGGKVYQYLHFSAGALDSGNMSNATFMIRVNKSWFSQNSLNPSNVSLYHFNATSSNWTEVPTVYVGSNSDQDYFNATVTSFSYFAIAQKPVIENATSLNNTASGNVTASGNTKNSAASLNLFSGELGWAAIAVAIIVVIVVYFLKSKGGKQL